MDKIVIEGGVPLEGEVAISGAKNAACLALAPPRASGKTEGKIFLRQIGDCALSKIVECL